MKTVGFIGGGRVTKIFLQAFQNAGINFGKVVVFDTNSDTLNALKSKFPNIHITTDNLKDVASADLVFIALHPPVLMEALEKIKDFVSKTAIVVSLAPKVTIDKMSEALDGFANLVRMNPSASTIANKGVNPVAFAKNIAADAKSNFLTLMLPLGYTPEVAEAKIEAYAVISAMGHTYFFFQLQKLKELAVSFGMEEKEAQIAITEMLWGTTETLFKSGLPYAEAADLVPVKPLAEVEETIKGYYDHYSKGIFNKIKPQ
jgi:pyrroline-5-carboxylate reductase